MVIGKHKINGGLAVQLLKAFKNSMQCRIFSTGYLGSKKASETPCLPHMVLHRDEH